MKYLKLLLILILLSACTTNKKEEIKKPTINIQKKPSSREENIKKSKNLPKSFYVSQKARFTVDKIEDFYNTDLGQFSYYKPSKDEGTYTVTWNLLDGSEVYSCHVLYNKNNPSTWCKCNDSEAFNRWLNGEELLEYQEEIIEDNKEEKENRDNKEIENKKLERYQEMCNNSNVSDYLDLYDEYEQEFEDEDDAYDFYYEYCK